MPLSSRESTPPSCGCLSCDCRLYHNLKTERDELRALVRELRQFIPYEKPEQHPLPRWIVEIRDRVDVVAAGEAER